MTKKQLLKRTEYIEEQVNKNEERVNKNFEEVENRLKKLNDKLDALAKYLNGSFEIEKSIETQKGYLSFEVGWINEQDTIKYTTVFKSNKSSK